MATTAAVQTELAEIDTGKSEATTVEHFYIAARLPQEDFRFLTGGKGIYRQESGNAFDCHESDQRLRRMAPRPHWRPLADLSVPISVTGVSREESRAMEQP